MGDSFTAVSSGVSLRAKGQCRRRAGYSFRNGRRDMEQSYAGSIGRRSSYEGGRESDTVRTIIPVAWPIAIGHPYVSFQLGDTSATNSKSETKREMSRAANDFRPGSHSSTIIGRARSSSAQSASESAVPRSLSRQLPARKPIHFHLPIGPRLARQEPEPVVVDLAGQFVVHVFD